MEKLKFVVFGAGRMGSLYIRLLLDNPNFIVSYIVVRSEETCNKLRFELNLPTGCQVITSDKESVVFNDSKLNAALICSPTHAHGDQVKQCLNFGLSVFCEKPISFSESVIKECYTLASKKNLHLFCAFQRRFDASFISAYERARSGSLGKLHFIKSCSRDGNLPDVEYLKTSGGFYKDSTVHDIDMVCWIAGELPLTVFAQGHAHRKEISAINDFDSVMVFLKFPSGLMAIIDQDRFSSYGYDQRLEIFGDKGMVRIENPLQHNCETYDGNGQLLSTIADSFETRYPEAYKRQLNNFVSLISSNEGSIIDAKTVLSIDKIAEAAIISSKTNKIVDMKDYY